MRSALLYFGVLLAVSGCDSMNRMAVDNPVMPDPPPRIQIAELKPSGSKPKNMDESGASGVTQLQYSSQVPELGGSQVVATVNGMPIFASDVLDRYRSRLVMAENQLSSDDYLDLQMQILKRDLPTHVENLMLVNALKSTLSPEQLEMLSTQLDKAFEGEIERMAEQLNVSSALEVDRKLQEEGLSLAERREDFSNQTMAVEYLRAKSKLSDSVERTELIAAYHRDLADYAIPARVHWEQISISFAEVGGREDALELLKTVIKSLKSGTSFAEVAKVHSNGPTAAEGGDRGWIEQHSLANEEIETALFQLPRGSISQVFEEDDSFEIVRVVDRQQAGYTPFEDVQNDIEQQILGERRKVAFQAVLDELRDRSLIVTMFDQTESTSKAPEAKGRVLPIPID